MLRQSQGQLALARLGVRSLSQPAGQTLVVNGVTPTPLPVAAHQRPKFPVASSFGGISISNANAAARPPRRTSDRSKTAATSDSRDQDRDSRRSVNPSYSRNSEGRFSRRPVNLGWSDNTIGSSFVKRLQEHSARKADSTRKTEATLKAKPTAKRAAPRAEVVEKPKPMLAAEAEVKAEVTKNASLVTRSVQPKPEQGLKEGARGVSELVDGAGETVIAPGAKTFKLQMSSPKMTNLDALFMAEPAPRSHRVKPSAKASLQRRVQQKGAYEHLFSGSPSSRVSSSVLGPVSYARHTLAARRDLSLSQRRKAMQIISGLTKTAQAKGSVRA